MKMKDYSCEYSLIVICFLLFISLYIPTLHNYSLNYSTLFPPLFSHSFTELLFNSTLRTPY